MMGTKMDMLLMAASLSGAAQAIAGGSGDAEIVATMDLEYQAAVKRNDFQTMDRILHPQFALVRGNGQVLTREEIIDGARSGDYVYEQQDEVPGSQSVRVWNDTAVVTAQLWLKGTYRGKAFDRHLWFSDTYVRTAQGWRYAFAQVSLPLPDDETPRK